MSVLQFISSIIESIAWPAAIVILLLAFKKYIVQLFPSISSLKYKDLEVQFSEKVKELVNISKDDIQKLPDTCDDFNISRENQLFGLLEISPRAAIIESWLLVETAASKALQKKNPDMSKKTSMIAPARLGKYLQDYKLLTDIQFTIYDNLREMRNSAVHIGDAQFNKNDVTKYINLAIMLANQIENAK